MAFTGALTSTMGVATLLTAGVSALGPELRQDLGLSRAEFGLFAVAVFLTTTALSIPFGSLADRLAPRAGLAITFVVAAAGDLGVALSQSLAGLLLAAAAAGGALALSTSVTNRLVSQYAEVHRRGRMIATKQMGVQIAQMLAGFACPLVAASFGWRAGIVSGAAVIVVMLVLVLLATGSCFDNSPPASGREVLQGSLATQVRPDHLLMVLSVYALLTGICFQATLFGLPLVGYETLRLDARTSSLAVVVLGAVGFAARLAWGVVADRFVRVRTVMIVLGATLFIGEAILLLAVAERSPGAFWAGAAVIGAGFALVPVVLASAVLQYFPVSRVGLISGVVSVSTFSGFAAGPFIFGLAVDHSGYLLAWLCLLLISLVAGLVPWLLSRQRPARPDPDRERVSPSMTGETNPPSSVSRSSVPLIY
jgi:MFS transporter, CP family, cyanate transporter